MKYIDSSYKFTFCIPTRENCDPDTEVNFNLIFLICFLCSFGVEGIAFGLYRFLTRGKRQQKYEEKLAETRRIEKEMIEENKNAVRVGMKDVNKKRAKEIAKDKAELRDFKEEIAKTTTVIDAAMSLENQKNLWTQHIVAASGDDDIIINEQVEMQPYDPSTPIINEDQATTYDPRQTLNGEEQDDDSDNGPKEAVLAESDPEIDDDGDNGLPDGWELHYDDGQPYYFNTVTQESGESMGEIIIEIYVYV